MTCTKKGLSKIMRQDLAVSCFVPNLSVVGKTALSLTADGNEMHYSSSVSIFFLFAPLGRRDIRHNIISIEEKIFLDYLSEMCLIRSVVSFTQCNCRLDSFPARFQIEAKTTPYSVDND